jgi:hypothetical protein
MYHTSDRIADIICRLCHLTKRQLFLRDSLRTVTLKLRLKVGSFDNEVGTEEMKEVTHPEDRPILLNLGGFFHLLL